MAQPGNLDVLMNPKNILTAFTVVNSLGRQGTSSEGPTDLWAVLASFSLCMQFPWRQIERDADGAPDLTLLECACGYSCSNRG